MASGYTIGRRNRRVVWAILGGGLAVALIAAWLAQSLAAARALEQVKTEARESLALQAEVLNGLLDKYRLMAPLLAKRSDIIALFADSTDADRVALAAAKATRIAALSGARDVAFAGIDGRIFASASGMLETRDTVDKRLFVAPRQGRLGREVVLSGADERSYVFTSAVRDANGLIGFIAVFVRFDQSEAAWSLSLNPIVVTRGDGTVFLSNRPDWLLRPLFENGAGDAVMVARRNGVVHPAGAPDMLAYQAVRFLPLLGWNLYVFTDYRPVVAAQRQAALVALLVSALVTGALWIVAGRRAAGLARQRRDRAASLRLERLVRDRTAKLTAANIDLAREVDERRQTEDKLRMTQSELVQAAKLAAIGQMSTALSHEYNQPLGAIRTYADNARQFLARNNPDKASEALMRIGDMVERISALSKTLLGFARKPGTKLYPVPVQAIVDEVLMLTELRARKHSIAIDRSGIEPGLSVMAGKVRLTQVLVNLVINAIDALSGIGSSGESRDGVVRIGAARRGGSVVLWVEDNGPGIDEARREEIFEPFYSTKGVGEGLGIGLSIVYSMVKDLGGAIAVEEAEIGGARFVVTLETAEAGQGGASHRMDEEAVA